MTLYYNAKTGGFYDTEIHEYIPEGSVEITQAEHSTLLVGQSQGKVIVPDRDGRPVAKLPAGPSLSEYKVIARSKIDARRNEEEAKGLHHTFPNGVSDVIQLRNTRDFLNIQALVTRAQMLQSTPGVKIPFQAESNTTHLMSPDEVLTMGVAVSEYCSWLYMRAWELKSAVDAAETKAQVDQVGTWVNI